MPLNPHDVRHRMDVSLRSLQRPRGARDAPELAWQGRCLYAHAELVKYIKSKEKAAFDDFNYRHFLHADRSSTTRLNNGPGDKLNLEGVFQVEAQTKRPIN